MAAIRLGVALGATFGKDPYLFGLSNADLGPLGMLVVRLLKTLATPLILFAILDSFLKTEVSARSGLRLLASVMAGVGIAGIPEAGLIILPLVLGAAGVPEATVAVAIPLIVPVDWIIARVRSGVNVMADMVVAMVLDRFDG